MKGHNALHVCSFSGAASDLPPVLRNERGVLDALRRDPKISTWDFGQHYKWLQPIVNRLIEKGKITEAQGEFPWHRYEVTE